jgi:signal peptidase I
MSLPSAPFRPRLKRAGRLVVGAGWLLVVAYGLLLLVPTLFGLQRYVLAGGSMEPAIARGSLVFDQVVPAGELGVGDVITYVPPGMTRPLTHRIVARATDASGRPAYTTRGDANEHEDPWRFVLSQPTQARVSLAVPYAGYPLWVLSDRTARLVFVGLPALVVVASQLRRLWRLGGQAAKAEAACVRG